jgi:IS30 family transposase
MVDNTLVGYVVDRLRDGWTPMMISGRLTSQIDQTNLPNVCAETLYTWIYHPGQQHRQLWQYLPRGRKKRRRQHGRRVQCSPKPPRLSIHDRPEPASQRSQPGHWEADTVLGVKGGKHIHTMVDGVPGKTCEASLGGGGGKPAT